MFSLCVQTRDRTTYLMSASLTLPSGVSTRLGKSSELISWIRSSMSRIRKFRIWFRWLSISPSILYIHDRMISNSARMLRAATSAFLPNSPFFSLRSSIFPLTYLMTLGGDSIEKICLEFRLEKSLEFWLEISLH